MTDEVQRLPLYGPGIPVGTPGHRGPGRPKGSLNGRAEALRLLDEILKDKRYQFLMKQAMAKKLEENPVWFFQKIIMPLLPKQSHVELSGGLTTFAQAILQLQPNDNAAEVITIEAPASSLQLDDSSNRKFEADKESGLIQSKPADSLLPAPSLPHQNTSDGSSDPSDLMPLITQQTDMETANETDNPNQ